MGIRFLPIPYPLVNYTAALAGVRPGLFLITTAIGLIPGNVVFTYFASLIPRAAKGGDRSSLILQFVCATAALILLTAIPQIWAAKKRRARYQKIRTARKTRAFIPSPAPPPPPAGR